jgi:hypothetical protein
MIHRMVQNSGAGAAAPAAAPAVAATAATTLMAARAVGHPGFFDGLSDVAESTGADREAVGGDRD